MFAGSPVFHSSGNTADGSDRPACALRLRGQVHNLHTTDQIEQVLEF
jgi:hypothetical protein